MILQGAYIPACWQRTGSRLPQHEKPREIPDRGERKAIPGRFPGRTRVAGDPTSRATYQLKIRVLVLRQVGFAQETARDSQKNGWMGDRLCHGLARYCSAGRIECPCLSTRFPARMVLQYLRDRPAPFGDGAIRPSDSWQGSPDSSRDSRVGRYRHFSRHGTSGIGPLPSGTERSGRPIHGKGRRTHPGTAGSAGIGTFPGMAPPGSARSLRGQSPSVIRFCGRGRLTQPASARDSQQGWYCSTSGIGPSRANQTCLSTGNSVDVA